MAGAAALGFAAAAARAQTLVVTEAAVGAAAVLAHRAFWGPELGVARRPGGQTRFAASAAAGNYEGGVGLRLQLTAQLLLKPADRSGVGPYAGLGLAFVGAAAAHGAGYLTALLGVEAASGRRAGWYSELGLGGGVRLAVGWRWRRFPRWW
ncbi:MAG TPA: hypothetical protein VH116_01670 [Gemmatimonadales bacterium]|nr:hypothetical protein [Gemmatimonadales bacterium]